MHSRNLDRAEQTARSMDQLMNAGQPEWQPEEAVREILRPAPNEQARKPKLFETGKYSAMI